MFEIGVRSDILRETQMPYSSRFRRICKTLKIRFKLVHSRPLVCADTIQRNLSKNPIIQKRRFKKIMSVEKEAMRCILRCRVVLVDEDMLRQTIGVFFQTFPSSVDGAQEQIQVKYSLCQV